MKFFVSSFEVSFFVFLVLRGLLKAQTQELTESEYELYTGRSRGQREETHALHSAVLLLSSSSFTLLFLLETHFTS